MYTGEWFLDRKHGLGKFVSPALTYTGPWMDDVFSGSNGKLEVEAHRFVQHAPSHTHKNTNIDLHPFYLLSFKLPSGLLYVGDFKEGLMHGKGFLKQPSGATYSGQFVEDLVRLIRIVSLDDWVPSDFKAPWIRHFYRY